MLRPSYSELMQILNENTDLDNIITSRYAVVVAASKRARQIVDEARKNEVEQNDVPRSNVKAVTLAVNEMVAGRIKVTKHDLNDDNIIEKIKELETVTVTSKNDFLIGEDFEDQDDEIDDM